MYTRAAYLSVKYLNLPTGTNFRVSAPKLTAPSILDKCRGAIDDKIPVIFFCTSCGRNKTVSPSCNQRNCERCQAKRSRGLFKKYFDVMFSINKRNKDFHNRWRFVLLTGYRITFDDKFGRRIKEFSDACERFLREEYPEGGILAVEMTKRRRCQGIGECELDGVSACALVEIEPEYYLHGHAIVWGERKDKPAFDAAWGAALTDLAEYTNDSAVPMKEIKEWGGRFTGLSTVRKVGGGLRYVLKYVAKGVDINDEQLEAMKRLKTVRTWGALYGIQKPRYDIYCEDCGGKVVVTWGDVPEGLWPDSGERLRMKFVLKPPDV